MSKLNRDERLNRLRDFIEKKISISTGDLVNEMDVSRMTLNRDLESLQDEGFIERFHGSVTLSRTLYDLDVSLGRMVEEKKAIAREAFKLIHDNHSILMGSGTTTLQLGRLFYDSKFNLTILTNSLSMAFTIHNSADIRLIVTGGDYHQGTRSLAGPVANRSVESLSGRILFFGANGVDPDGGLTAHFSGQADLINKMKSACKISVAMVNSSKFNKVSPFRICNLNDPDYIITDSNLSKQTRDIFYDVGAPLVIAEI